MDLKKNSARLGTFGLIGFLCMIVVSCAQKDEAPVSARTPFGEWTYGDQITPMNLCSIPKEDRPEILLGRPTKGQCKDDVDV